jgi:hypothetical protein
VIPGFNVVDPRLLATLGNRPAAIVAGPRLAQVQQATGFRPPGPMATPHLSFLPPSGHGVDVMSGLGRVRDASVRKDDPGATALANAIARDPSVQANPSTSAAGMLAGTNPDVGIGGGMPLPPDGSTGVGRSPYGPAPGFPWPGALRDFLTGLALRLPRREPADG